MARALGAGLARRNPELLMWRVGDPAGPALDAPDPEILRWCESEGYVLVTNNRHSMPVHLTDHLRAGWHVPGIFIVNDKLTLAELIENLLEVAELSLEGEYLDQSDTCLSSERLRARAAARD